jgi:bisanhydrobacterioruberin hydratase
MISLKGKENWAIAYIAMNHIIGLIGLNFTPYSELFALLTPVNLAVTILVILLFHTQFNAAFFAFFTVAFVFGMLVEALGVHTGSIFGEYHYTHILGPAVLDVPLIIGFNWFLLLYSIGAFLHRLSFSNNTKTFAGATLMVFADFLIEPFAIRFNLWQWTGSEAGEVPLQNYIAWWVISYLLFLIYYKLDFEKQNKVAAMAFPVMFFFFLLNIVLS